MSKRDYLRNMFWGFFILFCIFYVFWNIDNDYKIIIYIISSISAVLFPFSKWIVEYFFLTFTSKEFWNRGFFIDTPGRMGLLMLLDVFCFMFGIPFGVLGLYFSLKKRA